MRGAPSPVTLSRTFRPSGKEWEPECEVDLAAMSNDVEGLLARAVIGLDDECASAPDDMSGWRAIVRLRDRASRDVLDACLAACADADPLKRRVAAIVLGELGDSQVGSPVFGEERFRGLMDLLAAERAGAGDPDVMGAACTGLGRLHDPRAIPALLALRTYPEAAVRFGVMSGLSRHLGPHAPPAVLDALIALSADSDEDVRDWATFALGEHVEIDTPTVRAALHARLDDPYVEARHEAIEGLAKRGDPLVLPVLIRELCRGVAPKLLDAAAALATPDLCDALAAAGRDGAIFQAHHGPVDLTDDWLEAKRACGC